MHILSGNRLKLWVSVAAVLGGSAAAISAAHAGAFAVREQSAYYAGMSYAGAGVGDTLSSMYWNSAAAAAAPGMNTETHVALIIPDSEITASFAALGGAAESGDIADAALVPSSYANYQVTDRLYLGLATNSGFGLVTKPDNTSWAGAPIAITSDVFSININPTIAYKLTPELTIGVGAQIEYLDIRLNNGPGLTAGGRSAELDDFGFGATAGLSWTPRPGTAFGIGYRSAVNFDLEGDYAALGVGALGGANLIGSSSADLTLPDMVTIGLRQALTDRVDLLAGFEWTNWSRVGSIAVDVVSTTFGPVPAAETLRLDYEDGYFYSLGVEYDYSHSTTLRAGIAYEESPITDETRSVLLPDANRIWLSLGATYKYSEKISIDLGYSHIFAEDADICRSAPNSPCSEGAAILIAEGESSVDIVSASFKYKWGGADPYLEPLK